MDSVVETFKHAGHTIRIGWEEDCRFADPRDASNIETMVCWHPDYVLGDEQINGSRGAVETPFETASGRTDFRSMEVIYRYIRLTRNVVGPVLPLYLYDHSGISMSVGAPNPFDNPRVRSDHHGNGLGFDTSMVGYIFATEEGIAECCGDGEMERDPEWIEKQLGIAVDIYNAYLQGSVYWYTVEDEDGETVDSCGGFLVVEPEDMEEVRNEARSGAEWNAKEKALEHEPDMESAIYERTQA